MHIFTMLLCVTLLSAAANAEELSEDQWFEVSAVGFHHHGKPEVVALEQADVGKYFVTQRPFLSESFQKERLTELLEKSKDQEFKPQRSVPLKDPGCFAKVSRINNKEVCIKILKPLGAWRWHHHFQCLAIYKAQRNKTIDDIFALDKLYAKLSFTFQDIGHGMAGPDFREKDNAIIKALGEPDYEYPSQSPSLGRFYYEKHDLHIVTHEFVVYYVEKGKPDWVEHVKKERDSLHPATPQESTDRQLKELGAEESESSNELLVGEWDGRLDSDNRILVTFNPDGTFELVNVDPENQQRIKVRATGSFKIDFTVSPAHLDLQAIIRKPKHEDPVSQKLELILQMESLHSFRMSDLESPERPKAFGEKAVIFGRRIPHLSTPTVAIQFYKTAVAAGDWKMAQECLSSDLQEMLKEAIANRNFFDQYLVDDFANKTLELIPERNTTSEDLDELRRDNRLRLPEAKQITAQVGHGGEDVPWIAECTFVREQHGWKLTADRINNKEDFAAWYRKSIAEPDQGKARDREIINDKLQIALVLNAQGRLEQTGATMKLTVKNNSEKAINLSSLMQSSVLILNGQKFRLHIAFHDQWKNTMAITSGGSVEVTLPTAWYGIGSGFVASHYPEHEIEWQDKLYLGKHAVALRVEGGMSNVTQFKMIPDG